MQSELALVTLLNAAMALEDPFDNMGLDGIYLDEALYEVEQVGRFAQLSQLSIFLLCFLLHACPLSKICTVSKF